jgi:N-sulfoglucosamine sulfohydrolase
VAMYCDIVPTLIDIAGGKQPDGIDGRSLRQVLMGKTTEHRKYAFLVDGDYQRAIAGDRYKLIWTPTREELSSPTTRNTSPKLFYSFAWKEWLAAAKNDPDAKKKVDHVLKHPLYELYDIQKDPYEMVNLADDPNHAETLRVRLKNRFSGKVVETRAVCWVTSERKAPNGLTSALESGGSF